MQSESCMRHRATLVANHTIVVSVFLRTATHRSQFLSSNSDQRLGHRRHHNTSTWSTQLPYHYHVTIMSYHTVRHFAVACSLRTVVRSNSRLCFDATAPRINTRAILHVVLYFMKLCVILVFTFASLLAVSGAPAPPDPPAHPAASQTLLGSCWHPPGWRAPSPRTAAAFGDRKTIVSPWEIIPRWTSSPIVVTLLCSLAKASSCGAHQWSTGSGGNGGSQHMEHDQYFLACVRNLTR